MASTDRADDDDSERLAMMRQYSAEQYLSDDLPISEAGDSEIISDAHSEQGHAAIRRLLYISHFLSTWNSRVFEFGAFLFLANIYPQTLLPASVYALSRNASAALASPWIGAYIDRADRLSAVRISIVGQRLAVATSCVVLFAMMQFESLRQDASISQGLLALLAVLACVEKLCSVLNTISVERDFVVVVAAGHEGRLAMLNSQMRRIDLFAKLIGPLAIAFIDSASSRLAVLITGVMTLLSVLIEYFSIARVYNRVPALQVPKQSTAEDSSEDSRTSLLTSLHIYTHHRAFLPSLSLSLLYLTVLSFAGQMITYLLSLGLSPALIGGLRGVAALFELSATWLGPLVMRNIGAVRAGIWFLNWQFVCVGVACAFFWIEGKNATMVMKAAGTVAAVIASRVGLWGFDLSAQIIVQEEVAPHLRGSFSASEFALQNIFEMLAFASTIVFPRPEQFKYPATISAVAVGVAGVLYAWFVRTRRGHLLHLSSCVDPRGRKDHAHWWMLGVRREERFEEVAAEDEEGGDGEREGLTVEHEP